MTTRSVLTTRSRPSPGSAGGAEMTAAGNGSMEVVLQQVLSGINDIRGTLLGMFKAVYTVEEVARMTGRSPYTVRRWIVEKRLQATKVEGTGPKGRLLIPHDEVVRLIGQGLGTGVPAAVAAGRHGS